MIINGDGGYGFWQPTGGLTARVVRPGLRVGGRLAPCHINHMNRVNSRSGFELDDSTINIVVGIIIIIIIIIIITEITKIVNIESFKNRSRDGTGSGFLTRDPKRPSQ